MRRAFVDTSAWFAMADASDPRHEQMRALRTRELSRRTRFVITDYVVDETLTLLRSRLGIDAARRWWWGIGESDRVTVERVDPVRTEKALEWFFGWPDHGFSFTDCTSFVVMRELGLRRALTTDRHFAEAGFEVVPG